jgi:hypothetical protein
VRFIKHYQQQKPIQSTDLPVQIFHCAPDFLVDKARGIFDFINPGAKMP